MKLLFLLFLLPALLNADFFNDYLNDKTFGVDPGPCPFDDQSCGLNLETDELPAAIADIEFCITIFIFPICDELKDWVDGGFAEVWEVECEDLGVEEISLEETGRTSETVTNKFAVESLIQRCSGKARFTDVRISSLGVDLLLSVDAEFETDPRQRGLDIDFEISLTAAGGFDTNLVDTVDVNDCDLDLELGLSLDNTDFTNVQLNIFGNDDGISITPFFFENQIANILVTIIEGLLGNAICGVIEQAGFLNNGELGILNVVLEEVNEFYDTIIVPVDINIRDLDEEFVENPESFGATQEELDSALNLQDSNAVELVSTVLNSFLGDPTIVPLRINQAIDLLTEPDGFILFDLSSFDISVDLPLSFADASVTLESASFDGLNTVEFFSFLANDFSDASEGLAFTLTHDFELESFRFIFGINLRLKRGEWVTVSECGSLPNFPSESECSADQEEFTFDFGLTASSVDFGLATLTAINFDEIGAIQFGQILDVNLEEDLVATVVEILECTAPSIYAFILSDLSLSIGTVSDPFVDNFSGDGLDSLIESSVELINLLLHTVLANDLPNILRGPVRDFLNDFLRVNISDVSDTSLCPPYVQVPSSNPYLVFNSGLLENVFPVLTDVLGNFEADSDVDLNDLFQVILDYYSDNADEFPLESPSVGEWLTKDSFIPLLDLTAFDSAFEGAEDAFLRFVSFSIENFDTINEFSLESRADFETGASVQIGYEEAQEMTFIFAFDLEAADLVDDEFQLSMFLSGIDFDLVLDELLINLDEFFRLRIDQLTHIPCVQSLVDGIKPDITLSNVQASNIRFNIDFTGSSTSELRGALEVLQNEFETVTSQEQFTRIVNYFLGIGFEQGLQLIEQGNFSITPEICDDVPSNIGQIFELFTGFQSLNFTFFLEECLAPIPTLAPLPEFEKAILGYDASEEELGDKFFKNSENLVLKALSTIFSDATADPTILSNILIALANTTGNDFADLFVLESDNVTVNFEIPLNEPNFILDFLGLEPLIISDGEGFTAEAQVIRLRSINSFIEQMNLFQILSNFTTVYEVDFSVSDALVLEIVGLIEVNATEVALEPNTAAPIREVITASADLRGVTFDLELFAAVEREILISLGVSHFLTVNENQEFDFTSFSFDCFLKNFGTNGLNIRSFALDITEISEPQLTTESNNILSPGVEQTIQEVGKLFIEFYFGALPNICENCIRTFINDNLALLLQNASLDGSCPEAVEAPQISDENKFYRFSDSEGLTLLQDSLDSFLLAEDNELLNILIAGITNEDLFDTNPFDTGAIELVYNGDSYGSIQFILSNLRITNLNTFTLLDFFKPMQRSDPDFDDETDPFRLRFNLNFTGPSTFEFDTSIVGYDFFVQGPEVTNDVEFELLLDDVGFAVDFLLFFNINTLMLIEFNQVDSFEEFPCLFSPFQGLDVLNVGSSVQGVQVTLDCFDVCDSPLIQSLTATTPFTSDNPEEVAIIYNDAVEFAVGYLDSTGIEQIFSTGLSTLPETCSNLVDDALGSLEPLSTSEAFTFFFWLGMFIILLGVVLLIACVYTENNKVKVILSRLEKQDERALVLKETSSLLRNPQIRLSIRLLLPAICIVNIILICVSVVASDSVIIVNTITVLLMQINPIDLFPLSMSGIINDFWAADGHFVAVVLGFGVFVWPILRNLLLVFVWVIPLSTLGERNRFKTIQLLNLSGLVSFADLFVVGVALAALKTTVDLSNQEELSFFLSEEVVEVDISVAPARGLALSAIASVLSLAVNHTMSHYHRTTLDDLRKDYDARTGFKNVVPKRAKLIKKVMNYKFKYSIVNTTRIKAIFWLNILSGVLIVVGYFLPLVSFELVGLIGIFVEEIDPDQKVKTYSLYEIGDTIRESEPKTGYEAFSLGLLLIVYFIITFIAPLLLCVMLNVLLAAKLTLNTLRALLYVTVILASWAALGLATAAIFVTLLQVSDITQIVINTITNNLCFSAEKALGVFLPSDEARCLDIKGGLEIGALPIVLSVIIQYTVLICVVTLSLRVVDDWYFYAYVKTGQRKREGKPPKLNFLTKRIIAQLTVQKVSQENGEDDSYSLSQASRKSRDRELEEVGRNPTFSPETEQQSVRVSSKNPMFKKKSKKLSQKDLKHGLVESEEDLSEVLEPSSIRKVDSTGIDF